MIEIVVEGVDLEFVLVVVFECYDLVVGELWFSGCGVVVVYVVGFEIYVIKIVIDVVDL